MIGSGGARKSPARRATAFVVAALAVLVFAGVANASLTVNYVFTGHGGYSSDGLGQNGTGGTVQAEVPAGSTVQKAFLYGTYFTSAPDRTIDFDGTSVVTAQIGTVGGLSTTRADVTAQVAGKVGGGGGITDFVIGNDPPALDGVGLVVVYANATMAENTIAVLDGSASQTGDTATFLLAAPLDKTAPGFQATMSLGSGFSYQGGSGAGTHVCGGGQTSIVEVNSALLSNCAGNYDDGFGNNGGLITVGGVGDSIDNPTPPNAPATDDELYNLDPFLAQGATSIEIKSSNPSQNDNLFLAVISITARAQVSNEDCDNGIDDDGDGLIDGEDPDCQLTSAIVLDPPTATNPVGTEHTVTATVRGTDGALLEEVEVTFAVTAGPNSGVTGTELTDENGEASFTYTGEGGPGTDTIQASFADVQAETTRTATATKTWTTTASPPPPPAPPAPPPPPPPPPPADLTITITQQELPPAGNSTQGFAVAAGTRMRYTVTATNNGPGVARNAALTLGAPAGSSFDSVSTDTGSCAGSSTVSCSFGTLAAGQQAHVTSTATLAQAGPATATASVTASEPDPSSANNSASATVDVSAVPPQADPVFGDQAVPVVVNGFVCVQLPSSNECVDISTLTDIPVGSIIDATNGRVRLTVATAGGAFQAVELFEGMFQFLQSTVAARSTAARRGAASVTEFRLTGGDFSKCTAQPAKAKAKKKAKAKRKPASTEQAKPKQPVRRLWGSGSGEFRTRGRYSSATVRGTVWLTEDYCNGTLIRVREGTVTVRDLVKNRTVTVTAGKSYFAEAPAPKAAKAKAKKTTKKRKTAGG